MNDRDISEILQHKGLLSKVTPISTGVSSAFALREESKGCRGNIVSPSMLTMIKGVSSAQVLIAGSISQVIDAYSKAEGAFAANQSILKSIQHLNSAFAICNSVKVPELQSSLLVSANALQQVEGINALTKVMAEQSKMIEMLKAFKDADMADYTLEDVIEVAKPEIIEKQFNLINAQEDSEKRSYLRTNLISILSLILTIIMFVWSYYNAKETSKQNEKVISLLEQQNQIQTEKLGEEQQQTKLITVQTELLKELIIDIKNAVKNQAQTCRLGETQH